MGTCRKKSYVRGSTARPTRCKDSTCAAVRRDRRRCAQRCRLSDPTDAADGYESARAPQRRRRVRAHRDRIARSQRIAGRTRASGGGLCRRAQYIVRAYRKRTSCFLSRRSERASSTCCLPSEHERSGDYVRSRAIAALALSNRSTAATFEQPHSRVHFSNTYLRGSTTRAARQCVQPGRLSDRNGVACFAQASQTTIVKLMSRSQLAPYWRRVASTPAERQAPIIHHGQRATRGGGSDARTRGENRRGRRLLIIAPEAATWCGGRSKSTQCKKQRTDVSTVSAERRTLEPQLTSRP
jgi:hypothetical protein